MKKILLSAALILSVLTVHAQITGGTIMAGGNARLNRTHFNGSETSSTTVTVNPQFGVALVDNFVLGVWGGFSSRSGISNTATWTVAPFVRYFMGNFYTVAGYGYTKTGTVGGSVMQFQAGYAIFLSDNVALEPALYYSQFFNNGLSHSDVGLNLGFQIYFNR